MVPFRTRSSARKPSLLHAALAAIFVLPLAVYAQPAVAPADQLLKFASVSIKPIDNTPGAAHATGPKVLPGGQVTITTESLKGLIAIAYHLSAWQVTGGEPWTDSDQYDLDAKAPDLAPPAKYDLRYSAIGIEDEHLRQMLQNFLVEKFHLKSFPESKNGTVYILEKTNKPSGLAPTTLRLAKYYGEGFSGNVGHIMGKGWTLYNTSMPQLCRFISDNLQASVQDRTGLDGSYDFDPKTPESDADFQKPVADSIKPALADMGLNLKKSSGPVATFAISSADNPFPN